MQSAARMAEAAHAHRAIGDTPSGHPERRPERTLLHRTLSAHWPRFKRRADEHGGLPEFVVREFEDYLDCGRYERGCVVARCQGCGHERVVGLSCKHRGFCPSCCGRRMADSAANLVERVLPQERIRQWVASFPWQLRYAMGFDRELCAAVMGAFTAELEHSYRWRAKRALALRSVRQVHTGSVTFVQRFDSALRLSPHAHTLCLDGVYVRPRPADGALRFHPLPEPTPAEVAEVALRTATRIERVLRSRGRELDAPSDGADQDELALEHPALASCYQAAAGGRQLFDDRPGSAALRLLGPAPAPKRANRAALVADARGVNVHAARVVDGRDRKQLERLCRYLTRPPLAHERLDELPDGRLRLSLKTPWSDGTTAIVLTPMDLIARLCALVPPPRVHLTRFRGVLAPAASLRPEVVPRTAPDPALDPHPQLSLFDAHARRPAPPPDPEPPPRRAGRHPWAWLLRRVFAVDISVCPHCSGRMRIIEFALTSDAIARVLARHGLGPQPPPPPPQPMPGQLGLPGVGVH